MIFIDYKLVSYILVTGHEQGYGAKVEIGLTSGMCLYKKFFFGSQQKETKKAWDTANNYANTLLETIHLTTGRKLSKLKE